MKVEVYVCDVCEKQIYSKPMMTFQVMGDELILSTCMDFPSHACSMECVTKILKDWYYKQQTKEENHESIKG